MRTRLHFFLYRLFFVIIPLSLGIYGCSDDNPAENDNTDPYPRTSVPEVIVGEWQAGNVSSVNFYDPNSGGWGTPSGTGMFYKFSSDGYYEKGVLLQSTLYDHTMSFFAYNKGTMTVNDSVIVLYPTYGKIKSVDNQVPENNYEKDDELKSETILWVKGFDDYNIETLWLRNPDTDFSAFHRP